MRLSGRAGSFLSEGLGSGAGLLCSRGLAPISEKATKGSARIGLLRKSSTHRRILDGPRGPDRVPHVSRIEGPCDKN